MVRRLAIPALLATLLGASPAVSLDDKAKETYGRIRRSIEESRTLRMKFRSEGTITQGGFSVSAATTGSLAIDGHGAATRVNASVRITRRGPNAVEECQMEVVSDGAQVAARNWPLLTDVSRPAEKVGLDMDGRRPLIAQVGPSLLHLHPRAALEIGMLFGIQPSEPENLKMGEGSLTYDLKPATKVGGAPRYEVGLQFDPKTLRLLRRTVKRIPPKPDGAALEELLGGKLAATADSSRDDLELTLTETYDLFEADKPIPADAFALPKSDAAAPKPAK